MSFMEAIKSCFGKYASFCGRAPRSEYWYFVLFAVVGMFAAATIDTMIFGQPGMLYIVFILGTIVPNISVMVRRLHDIERSGWWYWIGLVPLVGFIVLLVFFVTEGTDGENNFGPDPFA